MKKLIKDCTIITMVEHDQPYVGDILIEDDIIMDIGSNLQIRRFKEEELNMPRKIRIPYPKLWEASGLSYTALISRLIELAIERHENEVNLKVSYD